MSTFSGNLSHGMFIEITNFGVRENTGLDRPTKHCFMLHLNYSSHIEQCEALEIDLHGWDLVSFSDSLSKKESDVYLLGNF